jgi:hypothetical protein
MSSRASVTAVVSKAAISAGVRRYIIALAERFGIASSLVRIFEMIETQAFSTSARRSTRLSNSSASSIAIRARAFISATLEAPTSSAPAASPWMARSRKYLT